MAINFKEKYLPVFLKNFAGGVGWAAGATIGFAFLISLLGFLLGQLGGLPIIGNFFASLIEVTNKALEAKKALP